MNRALRAMLGRALVAKILMGVLLVGGWLSMQSIRQEYLPDRSLPAVQVAVTLSGAQADDIETTVILPIENALRGIDGVDRVEASASEGVGIVQARLLREADKQRAYNDVKNAVDRIDTLPTDAERPIVSIPVETEKVMSLVVHGDQPTLWLRQIAERVRADLLSEHGLTKVELTSPRELEISVEIEEAALRSYGLSLGQVADIVRANASDLSGGTVFTDRADVALRTIARRDRADEFLDIPLIENETGQTVFLSDIAVVRDGFGESPIEAWFNGKPAIQIDLFAVGSETPLSIERTVLSYLAQIEREQRYSGVAVTVFENDAQTYRDRMMLLVDNAIAGLLLVLLVLGLFLAPKVAFWVMMGIPTAMIGSFLLLPLFGASINMISLFAFIVTIGVVVDDAIMMGEAIFSARAKGRSGLDAAVHGFKRMAVPILLAVTTTIIAFSPMFFIPGTLGTLFGQISAVVVSVLLVSLVEALIILVIHLARVEEEVPWMRRLSVPQRYVNGALERFTETTFRNFVRGAVYRPVATVTFGAVALMITFSAIGAGWLGFSFTPSIQSDTVVAQVTLPYGAPRPQSIAVQDRLVETANRTLAETGMTSPGIFSLIGARLDEGEIEAENLVGTHYISVLMALPSEAERTVSGGDFAARWRQTFGDVGDAEAVGFTGETSATGGEPLRFDLFHPDPRVAERAAAQLAGQLRTLAGLASVTDGLRAGKPEYLVVPKDNALRLGLTAGAIGRQIRDRYYGAEAMRIARDGNEVLVMVRLAERERQSLSSLQSLMLRTPSGSLMPLEEVARLEVGQTATVLNRRDGRRILSVTADILAGADEGRIEEAIQGRFLPALLKDYPGLEIGAGGEEEEIAESLSALGTGFLYAFGGIFAILALYFNNLRHPLIVLSVIPFALIGAVWGHIGLGYDLSIVSIIGIVAMAGVVVNDSVVLVTAYRQLRDEGLGHQAAIAKAACTRLRPILLTSLTTFFGLLPMMLETSEQAQFLIPMAVSLSFGLIAATLIVLVLVPALLGLFGDYEVARPSRPRHCLQERRGEPPARGLDL